MLFRDPQTTVDEVNLAVAKLERALENTKEPEIKREIQNTAQKVNELKEQAVGLVKLDYIVGTVLGLLGAGLGKKVYDNAKAYKFVRENKDGHTKINS